MRRMHVLKAITFKIISAFLFAVMSVLVRFLLGYFFFDELPRRFIFIGGAIVAGAGLFVIWRERRLGVPRVRAAEGPPG